ncbi:AMP-binding protein [Streptomyces huasconensis]|uniref:AMP-binding protein n=1 Tax=Streptomyces huasconensis TaxID=1854574 RepID=A0ABV3LN47_9ACTN
MAEEDTVLETPPSLPEEWQRLTASPDADVVKLICDRHPREHAALVMARPENESVSASVVTYGELSDRSRRLAASLAAQGIRPGDHVATLMGKSTELVVTLLAIWRLGAVNVPLFTAFEAQAIAARTEAVRLLVIDDDLTPKLRALGEPSWMVLVNETENGTGAHHAVAGGPTLQELEAAGGQDVPTVSVGGDGTFVMLYTSGTTGSPKGVPIPVKALAAFASYQHYALDHRADDTFWNMSDPAWGYGLYQALLGPLFLGRRTVLLRARFDPHVTIRALHGLGVTNFAAAPTVYRALRNHPGSWPPMSSLRCCSSAGEPLNPDLVPWAQERLGVPIRDHFGQTELGMVVGDPWHPSLRGTRTPGYMGVPLPGWRLGVLEAGTHRELPPGAVGNLAVDVSASPLMWFTGYAGERSSSSGGYIADGSWFLTGDLASRNAAGEFKFAGRSDDIILMAGYRISPVDVENTLLQHPGVAEAAVTAVTDDLRGEVLEAFVVPAGRARLGDGATDGLDDELRDHVKQHLAAHLYPRQVHFRTSLPKTDSGKVKRALLRAEREREVTSRLPHAAAGQPVGSRSRV